MYIDVNFWYICAAVIYVCLCIHYKNHHWTKEKIFLRTLFYMYLTLLIGVTFFPIIIDGSHGQGVIFQWQLFDFWEGMKKDIEHGHWMIPLKQIGGNFVLLMPFSIFLPMLTKKPKSFGSACIFGFFLSLFIETLQGFLSYFVFSSHYKIFDVDDLWLNALGFLVGYAVYRLFIKYFPKK